MIYPGWGSIDSFSCLQLKHPKNDIEFLEISKLENPSPYSKAITGEFKTKKFKGLDTFRRVLKSKEKFTGCSVHFVDEKLDNGKIVLKKRISIKKNFDEKRLKHNVQVEEYKAYSEAIRKIYSSS